MSNVLGKYDSSEFIPIDRKLKKINFHVRNREHNQGHDQLISQGHSKYKYVCIFI